MKRILTFIVALLVVSISRGQVTLSNTEEASDFSLVASKKAKLFYDKNDYGVVAKVAHLFAEDIERVTNKKISVSTLKSSLVENSVVIGTIGKNAQIDQWVSEGKIDTIGLFNKWESYIIQVIENPKKGVKKALVVVGSDRRGTAYGVFKISEVIGVSPWYWWADAPIVQRGAILLNVRRVISKEPSVKYRGIFINDEDWGLKPWASKNFEPEVGDIGPRTYSKICELLLRLKANYLCPAMHSCTKAFNYYPDNKLVADSFAIVMGSIHCEPLLFNNASEWDRKTMGDWNYVTNRGGINKVLCKRVKENAAFENVYTLAMRGIHDAVMAGNLTVEEQAKVLKKAFDDQREIIRKELKKPIEGIPQVFYPYKEVQHIYDHGMELPDDVTIVWTEDDFGYMKRLSNSEEQKRLGRSGVYYHVSYWGPPKHYLWVASTPPALMYEELRKAYDTTADRLWVVNVGDIKPAEYPITLFMDMAYDIGRFNFDNINTHSVDFLCNIFGEKYRTEFKDIQSSYFNLAFARKPEHMERGEDTEFSIHNYNEVNKRLGEYKRIAKLTETIMSELDEDEVPSFFQLLYYPVKGSALVNQMTLAAQKNRYYASQGRATALLMQEESKRAGDSLEIITEQYNALLNGKWGGMMSLIQGGARTFGRARLDTVKLAETAKLGVETEEEMNDKGMSNIYQLPCFNKFVDKSYYIDIYNKGEGTLSWNVSSSEPWIVIDKNKGSTIYEDRIYVSIDWSKVPSKEQLSGTVKIYTDNEQEFVYISTFNPKGVTEEELEGLFVENNGYASIDVTKYHRKHETEDIKFDVIEGLGIDNKVVRLGDPFADTPYYPGLELTSNYVAPVRNKTYPVLEYDFYTFQSGPIDVYTYMMPIFPLNDEHGSRYGVMVDNSPVYMPEASAPYYSSLWIQSVLRNCRINKTTHTIRGAGKHTIKIYCGHPGMMLQKIVVDLGGLKRSYFGPKSTIVN